MTVGVIRLIHLEWYRKLNRLDFAVNIEDFVEFEILHDFMVVVAVFDLHIPNILFLHKFYLFHQVYEALIRHLVVQMLEGFFLSHFFQELHELCQVLLELNLKFGYEGLNLRGWAEDFDSDAEGEEKVGQGR